MIDIIAHNGFIFLIPILIWNLFLTPKLPVEYDPVRFDEKVPKVLLVLEHLFRTIVFLLPLLFRVDITSRTGTFGVIVYIAGLFLYFASWLVLILLPRRVWRKNFLLFSAPATTPLLWLTGIGLMAESYYFNLTLRPEHYLIPSIIFVVLHGAHSLFAYRKKEETSPGF